EFRVQRTASYANESSRGTVVEMQFGEIPDLGTVPARHAPHVGVRPRLGGAAGAAGPIGRALQPEAIEGARRDRNRFKGDDFLVTMQAVEHSRLVGGGDGVFELPCGADAQRKFELMRPGFRMFVASRVPRRVENIDSVVFRRDAD